MVGLGKLIVTSRAIKTPDMVFSHNHVSGKSRRSIECRVSFTQNSKEKAILQENNKNQLADRSGDSYQFQVSMRSSKFSFKSPINNSPIYEKKDMNFRGGVIAYWSPSDFQKRDDKHFP